MWKDVRRLYANITPFYTDVRIHGFLYPQWSRNPSLADTERKLYTRVELLLTASTGFPGGASGKESASLYGRSRFDPWVWKTPWRRIWNPRQYFCLDTGAWQATVHGVAKSQTQWVTECITFTATLLIQATIISCLVFCNNRLADCSASSLMPLSANWRSLMASPPSYGKSQTP